MSVNYFVNNARSSKELITFESWMIWQLFNGNDFTDSTAAKHGYSSEIADAIVWANKDSNLQEMFSGQQKRLDSMSSVSFTFILNDKSGVGPVN